MPLVDIYLSGRKYTVSCEAGHEVRLRELADHVGGRLRELSESGVTGSDAHMLVLACLVITDQLFDSTEVAGRSRMLAASAPKDGGAQKDSAQKDTDRAAAASGMEALARRIEELAARLEQA